MQSHKRRHYSFMEHSSTQPERSLAPNIWSDLKISTFLNTSEGTQSVHSRTFITHVAMYPHRHINYVKRIKRKRILNESALKVMPKSLITSALGAIMFGLVSFQLTASSDRTLCYYWYKLFVDWIIDLKCAARSRDAMEIDWYCSHSYMQARQKTPTILANSQRLEVVNNKNYDHISEFFSDYDNLLGDQFENTCLLILQS